MKIWIAYITLLALVLGTIGCSMCCGPYDYDYPNFGGIHPRADQRYGRVGSIFSDPNAVNFGPSADSNLKPPPESRAPDVDPEGNDTGEDIDLDKELEKMRNELKLEESPEEILPMEDPLDPPTETLPSPDTNEDDPTASRGWQTLPLRPGQNAWR